MSELPSRWVDALVEAGGASDRWQVLCHADGHPVLVTEATADERDRLLDLLRALAPRMGWWPITVGDFDEERLPGLTSDVVTELRAEAAREYEELRADERTRKLGPPPAPNHGRALLTFLHETTAPRLRSELARALTTAPLEPTTARAPVEIAFRTDPIDEPREREAARIVLLPTDKSWEAVLLLGFGHFNACPPPAVHAAWLRKWEEDHGARLTHLAPDAYRLEVERPPADATRAVAVALEHDRLSADERPAAELLLVSKNWSFWWD
jgi:hypothetical protein